MALSKHICCLSVANNQFLTLKNKIVQISSLILNQIYHILLIALLLLKYIDIISQDRMKYKWDYVIDM